jgi:hypothetical protein
MKHGPRWVQLMKKTRGRKSRATVPLRQSLFDLQVIDCKTSGVVSFAPSQQSSVNEKTFFSSVKI